jgi:hypothetical protein
LLSSSNFLEGNNQIRYKGINSNYRNCSFFKKAHNKIKIKQVKPANSNILCYMFSGPLAGRRERKERERLQKLRIEREAIEKQLQSLQNNHQNVNVPSTLITTTSINIFISPLDKQYQIFQMIQTNKQTQPLLTNNYQSMPETQHIRQPKMI